MNQEASGEYLRNAVMTASAEQLQLMLYDGAIRFTRQARDAITASDFETSCEKLLRAQRIMQELENGLRPEINPELCQQLGSLYRFVNTCLIDANMKREVGTIDEALQILNHMRETWLMLMDKLRETAQTAASATVPTTTPRKPPKPSVVPVGAKGGMVATGSILSIEG